MSNERIGLSHSLPDDAEVVHSTILGVNSLGRVTDLLSAWCRRELGIDEEFLSDFRMLVQALLEFSSSKNGASGQIELAQHDNRLIVATRFPCRFELNPKTAIKELTQYWLNSTDLKLLKKMLVPEDQVEVRYHAEMNLLEWRVSRNELSTSGEIDHSLAFKVHTDDSRGIDSKAVNYTDLGDLPFNEWLVDAYKNKHTPAVAGEISVEGGDSQAEQEWARVVVDREKQGIDEEVEQVFKGDTSEVDGEFVRKFSNKARAGNNDDIDEQFPLEEVKKILAENKDLKEAAKIIARKIRKLELVLEQEKSITLQKNTELETLLRRKEYINQRNQAELAALKKTLVIGKNGPESSKIEHFRQKALEMFEMLKRVKQEKVELERTLAAIKRKDSDAAEGIPTQNQKQVEDLTKRLERIQRALEAEKVKVKTLSERVMTAEKEAQSAGPLIEDLETKMEHTLKAVQQHKKETEQVKLKLVQADADKNRIKNDLVKAHAQIQTMMKRQAS